MDAESSAFEEELAGSNKEDGQDGDPAAETMLSAPEGGSAAGPATEPLPEFQARLAHADAVLLAGSTAGDGSVSDPSSTQQGIGGLTTVSAVLTVAALVAAIGFALTGWWQRSDGAPTSPS